MKEHRIPSDEEQSESDIIILQVESSREQCGPDRICNYCEGTCSARQVNYKTTEGNQRFQASQIWASVCDSCDRESFPMAVAQSIHKQIVFHLYSPLSGRK